MLTVWRALHAGLAIIRQMGIHEGRKQTCLDACAIQGPRYTECTRLKAGDELLYLHKKGDVHERLEQERYAFHLSAEGVLKGFAIGCRDDMCQPQWASTGRVRPCMRSAQVYDVIANMSRNNALLPA